MKRRSTCRQCGGHADHVGRISCSGLCQKCGETNSVEFNRQMNRKSGPAYNLYARKQAEGTARYYAQLLAQIDERARAAEQAHKR